MNSKKLLLNSYFYKTNHNGWLTRAILFFHLLPSASRQIHLDIILPRPRGVFAASEREAENILIFSKK